jgi:predicted kinase
MHVGAWASEKYQRCRGQIWLISQPLLSQNINTFLDGAAANKEQRDIIGKKALDHSVAFQFHYVTSDAKTRKKRVFDRNNEQGYTYSLEVTPDMFAHTENFFEAPHGE